MRMKRMLGLSIETRLVCLVGMVIISAPYDIAAQPLVRKSGLKMYRIESDEISTSSLEAYEFYKKVWTVKDKQQQIEMSEKLLAKYGSEIMERPDGRRTFGLLAKENIIRLRCETSHRKRLAAESAAELVQIIRASVENQRPEQLLPYMACNFKVEYETESEERARYVVGPAYAVGAVLYYGRKMSWSSARLIELPKLQGRKAVAKLELPEMRSRFLLIKSEDGWVWDGITGIGDVVNEIIRGVVEPESNPPKAPSP